MTPKDIEFKKRNKNLNSIYLAYVYLGIEISIYGAHRGQAGSEKSVDQLIIWSKKHAVQKLKLPLENRKFNELLMECNAQSSKLFVSLQCNQHANQGCLIFLLKIDGIKTVLVVFLEGLSWSKWTFRTKIVNKGECTPGII